MAEETLLSLPLILGGLAFVFLVLLLLQLRVRAGLQSRWDQQRAQSRHADKETQKLNKQLLEVRSVVVGLGQKVTEQQDVIQHLNERIRELEHADTDGRLYSRASKMVQLGADINELIEECELPKAEAELMLSLQKKLAGKEKIPPLSSQPSDDPTYPPRGRRR
ncbi:LOW QUALITY PROTEIN: ATPase [Vibrio sp. JCM 19052]|nr:LOW QUALITY PROTEIN: ATPase [Vibrio sp. JCM 19052]